MRITTKIIPSTLSSLGDYRGLVGRVRAAPRAGASDAGRYSGVRAPDFTLQYGPEAWLTLSDLRGRPVILAFFPGDSSPFLDNQLAQYREMLPAFHQLGAVLVGISPASAWSQTKYGADHEIGFPLLADFEPEGAVARAYGAYLETENRAERAVVIIDSAGFIRWSHVSKLAFDPHEVGILDSLHGICERGATAPRPVWHGTAGRPTAAPIMPSPLGARSMSSLAE